MPSFGGFASLVQQQEEAKSEPAIRPSAKRIRVIVFVQSWDFEIFFLRSQPGRKKADGSIADPSTQKTHWRPGAPVKMQLLARCHVRRRGRRWCRAAGAAGGGKKSASGCRGKNGDSDKFHDLDRLLVSNNTVAAETAIGDSNRTPILRKGNPIPQGVNWKVTRTAA